MIACLYACMSVCLHDGMPTYVFVAVSLYIEHGVDNMGFVCFCFISAC